MCAFYVPHPIHQQIALKNAPGVRSTDIKPTSIISNKKNAYHTNDQFFNNYKYTPSPQDNKYDKHIIQAGAQVGLNKHEPSRNERVDTDDYFLQSNNNVNNRPPVAVKHFMDDVHIYNSFLYFINKIGNILGVIIGFILLIIDYIIFRPINFLTDIIMYDKRPGDEDLLNVVFAIVIIIIILVYFANYNYV